VAAGEQIQALFRDQGARIFSDEVVVAALRFDLGAVLDLRPGVRDLEIGIANDGELGYTLFGNGRMWAARRPAPPLAGACD
jgi:hypothetical protein